MRPWVFGFCISLRGVQGVGVSVWGLVPGASCGAPVSCGFLCHVARRYAVGRALGSGLVSGVGSDGGRGGSQCDRGFAGFVFLYVVRAGRWGVGLGLFFGPWTVHHVVRPSLVLWFSLSRG